MAMELMTIYSTQLSYIKQIIVISIEVKDVSIKLKFATMTNGYKQKYLHFVTWNHLIST